MSNLPDGWEMRTLGDLGRYLNGRAFKSSDWGSEGRPIIRIQNLTGSGDQFNYFAGEVEDRYIVRPGDLLVSWAATLGAYFWDGPEGVLNQHIFKVESNIDKRFHKYLIESKIAEMLSQTHGSGMVHITKSKFDAIPVAVPPLDEQQRIVATLEDHLSRLDAATESLSVASERAQGLLQSAVGSLTRAQPGWQPITLKEVASSIRNGIFVSRPQTEPSGVPILRIGSVRSMTLDLGDLRYTGLEAEDLNPDTDLLAAGDLLFTRYNGNPEYVAACAEVPHLDEPLTYPDKLIRVRLKKDIVHPSFLAMVMSTGPTRRYLRSKVKTTAGQAGISGRDLKEAPLVLPSLVEQVALAESFAEFRIERDAAVASVNQASRLGVRLRRSLLEAAFSGQLTKESSLV